MHMPLCLHCWCCARSHPCILIPLSRLCMCPPCSPGLHPSKHSTTLLGPPGPHHSCSPLHPAKPKIPNRCLLTPVLVHRRLYDDSGRFELGNMQDWQHSAMYAAFMVSGAVDLIGVYCPGVLPGGSEHVRVPPPPLRGWGVRGGGLRASGVSGVCVGEEWAGVTVCAGGGRGACLCVRMHWRAHVCAYACVCIWSINHIWVCARRSIFK